jgi:hypothetical protein
MVSALAILSLNFGITLTLPGAGLLFRALFGDSADDLADTLISFYFSWFRRFHVMGVLIGGVALLIDFSFGSAFVGILLNIVSFIVAFMIEQNSMDR